MSLITENYFNIWYIFRNELIGNTLVFIILGSLVITYGTIRYRMPWQLGLLFNILWFSIIFEQTKISLIWILVILITGFIFYYSISKFANRG